MTYPTSRRIQGGAAGNPVPKWNTVSPFTPTHMSPNPNSWVGPYVASSASEDNSATQTPTGLKYDGGKIRYGLLPPIALAETAKVLTFGAQKYAPDNWRYVENWRERYFDAAMRHMWAYKQGEALDPETSLPHLAHAICCLMFLCDLETTETEKD